MATWFRVSGLKESQERWASWAIETLEEEGAAGDSTAPIPLVKGGVLHLPPEGAVAQRLVEILEEGTRMEVAPVERPGAGRILAARVRERLARLGL